MGHSAHSGWLRWDQSVVVVVIVPLSFMSLAYSDKKRHKRKEAGLPFVAIRALRVIIDLNAARLSVFALPRNLANVLRRGDARAGAAGHRARDRFSVSAAHQFAPRIHLQVTRANSLRAAAGDFKDP